MKLNCILGALLFCLWFDPGPVRAQAGVAPDDTTVVEEVVPAATVAPATDVRAEDVPDDNGHALQVRFAPSGDDRPNGKVLSYEVYRSKLPQGPWELRGTVAARGPSDAPELTFRDAGSADPHSADYFPIGQAYYYRIRAEYAGGYVDSEPSAAATGKAQWFHTGKTELFWGLITFTVLVLFFTRRAKKGQEIYFRPLPGIAAIDDAVGRATEMGRPILYITGLGIASDPSAIAAFTVLGRLARKVADYQTRIIVPCFDPVIMTIAKEIVLAAYTAASRADRYQEDDIYYVTSTQLAYVSAVTGTMLREKPAANFYLGYFLAESLILAETGAMAGSIQIAGTENVTQIPFFVVACDYTLIGEELFAASAYLGRDPALAGTLKAQDWAKVVFVAALLIGILATLLGWHWLAHWFQLDL